MVTQISHRTLVRQLLECYEIEAVLISSPEGMLALPHLLAANPGLIAGTAK
jgi:hypothetical protein